jgi:hypothetical protein
MDGEARAKLVDAIARLYSPLQLEPLVRRFLNIPLDTIVAPAPRQTTVEKLMDWLDRRPEDRETFLTKLSVTEIRLRGVINAYFGMPADPAAYDSLIVLDLPFVDRQISRDKLRELFQKPNRRAMVVRGPRAAGKSHFRWLIELSARSEGIEPVFVELKDNTIEDVVGQIINDLSLPQNDFRDRLAQASTITKGFVSALRGWARRLTAEQRWCLIFDSHDYDTVDKTLRDFVDALLAEAVDVQMPGIWMVVLGHRAPASTVAGAPPSARLITDNIVPMSQPDVEKFLEQVAAQTGATFAANVTTEIFQGLTPPLDHEGMATLAERLLQKLQEAGAGV